MDHFNHLYITSGDSNWNCWVFTMLRSILNIFSLLSSFCCSILQSHNTGNLVKLIEPCFLIFWSFALVFLFCNVGESVTTQFNSIHRTIYECDWYLYPNNLQRILPTIMVSTQKPVILRSFGNVDCTREAFKSVRKKLKWKDSIQFKHFF